MFDREPIHINPDDFLYRRGEPVEVAIGDDVEHFDQKLQTIRSGEDIVVLSLAEIIRAAEQNGVDLEMARIYLRTSPRVKLLNTSRTIRHTFADDRISVNPHNHSLTIDNSSEIFITKRRFQVLNNLARNCGMLVSKESLYRRYWNITLGQGIESGSLNTHIGWLRGMFREHDPALGDVETGAIRTIKNLGFMAVESLSD